MKKKFLQTLQNNISFIGKNIGVAVSGGVDSVVLLDVFQKIKKKYNLKIFTLHYNHKWRKDSFKDAELVKEYSKKCNFRFVYGECKGPVIKSEENARNERYSFLKEVAVLFKLDFICTAHHLDDQVETILFRLARGTGPAGLLPIKQVYELDNKVRIIRPLLSVTKENIYEYAFKNKLHYREDETNKDISYVRNLIRIKIIPYLKMINKDFEKNIINCCELIYSEHVVLNEYFFDVMHHLSTEKNWKLKSKKFILPLSLSRKRFLSLNVNVQKSFIYWLLSHLNIHGNLRKINTLINHIKLCDKVVLNNNCILNVTSDKVILEEKEDIKKEIISGSRIAEFILNSKNKNISLDYKKDLILRKFNNSNFNFNFPQDKESIAFVDMSDYKNKNLLVRTRTKGDIFQPLGFNKIIKLKNYFINKKISRGKRYDLPLLCYGNEVLWIPGYSVSEKLKVVNKPTHIMEVKDRK